MNERIQPRHTLHQHQGHLGWNNAFAPVLRVHPGETIEFHPLDASGGQITTTSTVADITNLDFARVGRLTPKSASTPRGSFTARER